jgi:hypothetical protein
MVRAANEGRSVEEVLRNELIAAFDHYGAAGRAELGNIVKQWSPGFNDYGSFELAEHFGVDEIIARAAQAVMRSGTHEPDAPLLEELIKGGVQTAVEKYGAAVVASRETNASYAETQATLRSEQLMLVARMSDDALSYRRAKAEAWVPSDVRSVAVVAPPPPPQADAPQALPPVSRSSVGQDVLLGVTVAAALGALYWWARAGEKT